MQNNPKIQKEQTANNFVPIIPNKRYFTIGEVAKLCNLKTHVLRYWELEFKQLKPTKRNGNRRYYQHKDVLLIYKIKQLLYGQGFTISGAKQYLMDNSNTPEKNQFKDVLSKTIKELESLKKFLENTSIN